MKHGILYKIVILISNWMRKQKQPMEKQRIVFEAVENTHSIHSTCFIKSKNSRATPSNFSLCTAWITPITGVILVVHRGYRIFELTKNIGIILLTDGFQHMAELFFKMATIFYHNFLWLYLQGGLKQWRMAFTALSFVVPFWSYCVLYNLRYDVTDCTWYYNKIRQGI